MNQQLLENNYLIIDDFIPLEKAKFLYDSFKKDSESYPQFFQKDNQCPNSLAIYDYKWFLALLVEKIPFMSNIVQEPILPTYSYARIYSNGEKLLKHKDRPSCEISVSLHLGGDKDWEIYFTKPNNDEVSVILKPGQAVIYLGMNSVHWREAFQGTNYGQVFLHYVRLNEENWIYYFDKPNNMVK
jgi:hypothetical protein